MQTVNGADLIVEEDIVLSGFYFSSIIEQGSEEGKDIEDVKIAAV